MAGKNSDYVDPRHVAARRQMEEARAKLAKKQRGRRSQKAGSGNVISMAWWEANLPHFIMLTVGLSLAVFAFAGCLYALNRVFVVGRVVALPTGILCALVASFTSHYFLNSVQATFYETVELEASSIGDWKEWFWTLPSTLGMFVWALTIGYVLSLPMPGIRTPFVLGVIFLAYPFFQLSTLETESPLIPVSGRVGTTLLTHSANWLMFYGVWAIVFAIVAFLGLNLGRRAPLVALALTGPTLAIIVVGYALTLGSLAKQFKDSD